MVVVVVVVVEVVAEVVMVEVVEVVFWLSASAFELGGVTPGSLI